MIAEGYVYSRGDLGARDKLALLAVRVLAAPTVLVFESPAKDMPLARRTAAHLALLRQLAVLISPS